jgi:hypothetical protein
MALSSFRSVQLDRREIGHSMLFCICLMIQCQRTAIIVSKGGMPCPYKTQIVADG